MMSNSKKPENTGKNQRLPQHFKPGQSGNPAGRPKGSRNRLSEDFLKALQEDFEKHGAHAICAMRLTEPVHYIKTIASLVPSQFQVVDKDGEAITVVIRKDL